MQAAADAADRRLERPARGRAIGGAPFNTRKPSPIPQYRHHYLLIYMQRNVTAGCSRRQSIIISDYFDTSH
jgi:hypothetical protein